MEKHQSVQELADFFLGRVTAEGKSHNFFMSREYIEKAGLIWDTDGDVGGWMEPGYDEWFFPPLRNGAFVEGKKVWAGFPEQHLAHFLDEEYIYDPARFLNLSGNQWKVFRRNVKHWVGKTEGWVYRFLPQVHGDDPDPEAGIVQNQVSEMLEEWAKGRELYNPELFASFILNGEKRWGLFDTDGNLCGMNVADENAEFINFRYCIDSGEEKLNEYMRFLFYTSAWVQNKKKLVNDGGSLGSEGLARFKQKLRPVTVRKIYSSVEV